MIAAIKQRWERAAQRPFAKLVRLFAFRVFHGSGEDSDDLGFSMGLILSLLALPGGFSSLLLFDKYATFLQVMRGDTNFDPLAAALPDEYFFIVLSMVVTGAVAVWKWDSIFPDKRDYMNLAPLPIRLRTIFFANLLAVSLFAGLLALDVNALSAFLFPVVVSASQQTFRFFAEFAVIHAITVVLAGLFSFLAVFSGLGVAMAILPPRAFRRISPYIRFATVIGLLSLLTTTSAVPRLLGRLALTPHSAIQFLPSGWFLGLCQAMRGRATPELASLGRSAIIGFGMAIVISMVAYAVSYRRYFIRIPEMSETPRLQARPSFAWVGAGLDRIFLRTPFQRGCGRFIWKTLLRSERHGLVIAGLGGWGLVLASQAILRASERSDLGDRVVSADALSVPLILVFCMVIGMRLAFEIPVDLRANWIFRLLLDPRKHECAVTARRMILLTLAPLVVMVFPVFTYLGGWEVGILHTILVSAWTVGLTELLLVRFRKIPFTCSFPLFEQHAVVTAMAGLLGYFCFAPLTADFEHWALAVPLRMLVLLVPGAGVWLLIRHIRGEMIEFEKQLVFETVAARAVEVLSIGG
jgi:hypothetical protein